MIGLEDDQLVEDYINGDEKAFEKLFHKYKIRIFNFIYRMIGDRMIAEDILQEVFLKVIKWLPRYHKEGKFSGWLFSIANSITLDYIKKRKRIVPIQEVERIPDLALSPRHQIEEDEKIELIEKAVKNLPLKQRQIFLLRQHTDLKFKEIAEMLGCPLNTVLARMHNAILNLRRTLVKSNIKNTKNRKS
jgi:RNA polymerase sigma-70 factor (ECF subfamily)